MVLAATKYLPGATVQQSKGQKRGDTYSCANGSMLQNLGEATTEARLSSATGRARSITWQNVKIEFPILGTKALAADPEHRSEIRYRDDGGSVVELQDNHSSPFISHGDVYVMKVCMRTKLLRKPEGFVRPGAAP